MNHRPLAACCLCLLALLPACGGEPSAADQAAIRQEIQTTLEGYLPLLADAYATGDLRPLEPWAAIKEVARVHKRIEDYAVQGRRVVPTFHQVTVEEVTTWSYSNAVATSLEVWDVEVRAIGSDQILASEYEQSNRVKYQLERDGDGWHILFRTIQE